MKKYYETTEWTWIWDTDTERWYAPRPQKAAVVKEIPQPEAPVKDDSWPWERGWKAILHRMFVEFRSSPAWDTVIEAYDEEDNAFFNLLETYYKNGKLKVKDSEFDALEKAC